MNRIHWHDIRDTKTARSWTGVRHFLFLLFAVILSPKIVFCIETCQSLSRPILEEETLHPTRGGGGIFDFGLAIPHEFGLMIYQAMKDAKKSEIVLGYPIKPTFVFPGLDSVESAQVRESIKSFIQNTARMIHSVDGKEVYSWIAVLRTESWGETKVGAPILKGHRHRGGGWIDVTQTIFGLGTWMEVLASSGEKIRVTALPGYPVVISSANRTEALAGSRDYATLHGSSQGPRLFFGASFVLEEDRLGKPFPSQIKGPQKLSFIKRLARLLKL